jgi:hypothetical protein
MPLIFIDFAVTLTALGPFSLPLEKTIDFNQPQILEYDSK